ncbi:AT-rich interactive domain-containing protein 2-like isoform X2 [Liolophura sinensis]|uniref:AT-rich interactive domain-containing protein 2-like isoform X2 n=1 Tax=Liolophura sinensis TaxID=3198878 RepID=UPI0031587CB4
MALDLNKDPYTYAKDYEGFIKDLKQFHSNRGTPFVKLPQLGGRVIDLYLLYRRVIALGGWQKVNDELRWEDIQEEFRIPRGCPNGSTALKQIYIRYLDLYEKVHFLGEDPKYERMEYEDETSARKKSSSLIHGVPLYYNHQQHNVSRYIRQNAGMSCKLYEHSDYDKLEKAFLCGLPNEVDFSMNVCLLLSNEGKHVMKLGKSKHLLELMLANVGIFSTGMSSLQELSEDGWSVFTGRDYVTFWYDTVEDEDIRALILPLEPLPSPKELTGEDVLNLKRKIGINDAEGQRILQMAVILRNLSFESENCNIMASDPLVFRFLILCSHNKYGCLKQIGLDTLGNIASKFVLSAVGCDMTDIMLNTVRKCLVSADKFEVVRGLEILSKLCRVEKNEDVMADKLGEKSYQDIVQLLTIHDIQLIVYTLEALYQLSELGESTTTKIASVRHAVDVLVSLTTIEAQSYGPNSLMGIKVVEYVPPPQAPEALPGSSGPPPSTQAPQPAVTHTPHVARQGVHHTPSRQTVLTSTQHVAADSESFACNWLKANYEYKEGNVSQMSIYSDYLAFCGRIPIKDVVTSAVFIDCIRTVFPQAEKSTVEKSGNVEVTVKGLVKRALPLPVAIPPQGIGQYQPAQGAPHSTTTASQGFAQPPPSPSSSYSVAQGSPQVSPSGTPYVTPQPSPNRPMTILQKQLQSPPQNSPAYKKGKKQSKAKFPSINKALQGEADSGSPQKHNGSPNKYTELEGGSGSTPKKSADSNLIKTLLAKKLNENMIRQNAAAALQASERSSSPMPSTQHHQQQQQQGWSKHHSQQQGGPTPHPYVNQQARLGTEHSAHGATVHRESHPPPPPYYSHQTTQQSDSSQWHRSTPHVDVTQTQQQQPPLYHPAHPNPEHSVRTELPHPPQQSPSHLGQNLYLQLPNNQEASSSVTAQSTVKSKQPEVCGEVERAQSIVPVARETKIECIENQSVLKPSEQQSNSVTESRTNPSDKPSLEQNKLGDGVCENTAGSDPLIKSVQERTQLMSNCLEKANSGVCPMDIGSPTEAERPAHTESCGGSEPKPVSERLFSISTAPVINGCLDESSKESDLSYINSPPSHMDNGKHNDRLGFAHALPNGVSNGPDPGESKDNSSDSLFMKEEILKQASVEKAAKLLQSRNGVVNHLGNGDYFSKGNNREAVQRVTECAGDKVEDSCDSFSSATGVYRADSVSTAPDDILKSPCSPGDTIKQSGFGGRIPQNGAPVNGIMEFDNSCGSDSQLPSEQQEKPPQNNGVGLNSSSELPPAEGRILDSKGDNKPCAMEEGDSGAVLPAQTLSLNGPCQGAEESLGNRTADNVTQPEKTVTDVSMVTPVKAKSKHSKSKGSTEKSSSSSSKKSKSSEKEKKPKARKRSRSNTSQGESQSSLSSTTGADLLCEWDGCKKMFEMPKAVFNHTFITHLSGPSDGVCKWEGCDKLQRKRWSLVTHVQDHHCSEQALKLAAQRRQQSAQMASPTAQQPAASGQATALVYPPDAAIQAIRRFSARPPFQELVEPREGPVTKHIRLTASLVLRNLARYSAVGRSLIKRHEQQISYTALSAVESSSAMANCLWAALHDH